MKKWCLRNQKAQLSIFKNFLTYNCTFEIVCFTLFSGEYFYIKIRVCWNEILHNISLIPTQVKNKFIICRHFIYNKIKQNNILHVSELLKLEKCYTLYNSVGLKGGTTTKRCHTQSVFIQKVNCISATEWQKIGLFKENSSIRLNKNILNILFNLF